MRPFFAINYSADVLIANAIISRQLTLSYATLVEAKNLFHLILGKLTSWVIRSVSLHEAGCNRMIDIFLSSHPFKIFQSIVGSVPINVINFWLPINVWQKCFRHKAMDTMCFANTILMQNEALPKFLMRSWGENSPREAACSFPVASYAAKRANRVNAEISRNREPCFIHAVIIKDYCLSGLVTGSDQPRIDL